jgi:hypothetical protein
VSQFHSSLGKELSNESILSDREKRMHRTYSELFNLQTLLEKSVRNVTVSNNLDLIRSNDPSFIVSDTTKLSKEIGVNDGRPYYPGSSVRGTGLIFGLVYSFKV